MIGIVADAVAAGRTLTVLIVFVTAVLSVALSAVVLTKGILTYREDGQRAVAVLALGIVLVSGAPVIVNLGLATVWSPVVAEVARHGVQIVGLGVVLKVIYGGTP